MLEKIWKTLLVVLFFVLPFQTRWIYHPVLVNGGFWEYGSQSWYATEIILWLVVIMFLVDRVFLRKDFGHLFGKIHFKAHRQNLVFWYILIIFFGLEVFTSISPAISYNLVFHILEGLCLFLIVAISGVKKNLVWAMWGGGVAQAILGMFQFISQTVFASKWLGMALQSATTPGSFVVESGTERWLRAYGTSGSPNILGGYLAVVLVVGLILYLNSKPWHKIFLTAGQCFVLIALLLSFSRGAWLAAMAGILGVSYLWLKNNDRWILIKELFFYFAIITTIFIILKPLLLVRFNPDYRLEARSLSERSSQFVQAKNFISEHPFFGLGPGTYTLAEFKKNPHLFTYQNQPVHNIYALVLTEWGLPGLALWLALFIWFSSQVRKKNPEWLAVILVLLVAGLFDHYFWSLFGGILIWWAVWGLAFDGA